MSSSSSSTPLKCVKRFLCLDHGLTCLLDAFLLPTNVQLCALHLLGNGAFLGLDLGFVESCLDCQAVPALMGRASRLLASCWSKPCLANIKVLPEKICVHC